MDIAVSGATPTQPPIPPIPQRPVDQAPPWVVPVIRQTIWRITGVGMGMAARYPLTYRSAYDPDETDAPVAAAPVAMQEELA